MKDVSLTVESLRSKIEKLVHLHRKGVEDNTKLAKEVEEMRATIEKQKQSIKTLENNNKVIQIAKSIKETNENPANIKSKINELVREIDKCIALLNK